MGPIPTLNRRTFMAGGAGTLAMLLTAPQASTATAKPPYSRQAWQPVIGLHLKTKGGAIVRLEKLADLKNPAGQSSEEREADSFLLHFKVLSGSLESGLITVHHPHAGAVPLFTTQSDASAVAIIDQRNASMSSARN